MEHMFENPFDFSGYTVKDPDGHEFGVDGLLDEMRNACIERVEYLIDELPNASDYEVAMYMVIGMVAYGIMREEDRTILENIFSQMC